MRIRYELMDGQTVYETMAAWEIWQTEPPEQMPDVVVPIRLRRLRKSRIVLLQFKDAELTSMTDRRYAVVMMAISLALFQTFEEIVPFATAQELKGRTFEDVVCAYGTTTHIEEHEVRYVMRTPAQEQFKHFIKEVFSNGTE